MYRYVYGTLWHSGGGGGGVFCHPADKQLPRGAAAAAAVLHSLHCLALLCHCHCALCPPMKPICPKSCGAPTSTHLAVPTWCTAPLGGCTAVPQVRQAVQPQQAHHQRGPARVRPEGLRGPAAVHRPLRQCGRWGVWRLCMPPGAGEARPAACVPAACCAHSSPSRRPPPQRLHSGQRPPKGIE